MYRLYKRSIYTMAMWYKHRLAVASRYGVRNSAAQIINLNLLELKNNLGIEILVLDFDGVLAAHGDITPLPEIQIWLGHCVATFGAGRVFILSNKPMPQRLAYFQQNFPEIKFIRAKRKKPYPDGLQQIIAITKTQAHKIMLVDDRLLTGILAACITGVQSTYITNPYTNLKQQPLAELFFMLLRGAERGLVWLIK
jgi:uncharacterized protein